ncbi:ATP-binding protein [Phenylobacterium sp.]|uniref:hybrid sensor histidine kinase/response regulator n=1 Tax=Phenylobacterium sp. TaxID=1871053 RepID=UPI0025CCA83D|nr:ATP-binding protein [Phenylobacterium sp.]
MALAISAASLAGAVVLRGVLLGFDNATGLSATTFPALIVATLYAGPRWGWATLAAALAIGIWAPLITAVGVSNAAVVAMFTLSAILTIVVSSSLREALLRLDEANAAQAVAQQAVQATERRFRTLADSAPILMWVTRTDGKREFANKTYVDFLGAGYDAALDFDWRKVLHPDDIGRILQEQVAGEASRQLFTLEARFLRHDGEYRWVRSVSQPRWAPDGTFDGFIGVGYDITDAKRAEADLKRINDLLAERIEAALAERDEAEAALQRAQKLEAVGQLTGGVAHDFNNLLTVVIGALDLMQRHPGDAARRERMIEAAMGAARRGERLTQQLLAFSRRQALKPEPLVVDGLLKDAEPLLRRAVGEAVTLIVAPGAPDAVVDVDPSQFEAAIMNLVVNARDATPAGGMIRIETLPVLLEARQVEGLEAGDYLCVGVHDTGAGMDDATIARAFEPFFTTKEQGRGTGLGLSQVYGFARQSGGAATVDSKPGKGASVCLYLPRKTARPAADGQQAARPRPGSGPALRVLLVEDDAQVAELVEAMLAELGHAVSRAEHAEAALVLLNAGHHFDLMLTDLIMPGDKSGVDLAREAVGLRPGLPVILSSGYTGEVLSAAEETPWPLLRKPYGAQQLADTIAGVASPK